MKSSYRTRRIIAALITLAAGIWLVVSQPQLWQREVEYVQQNPASGPAVDMLELLAVKGRAPKTGYERSQFGDGWELVGGCDMRNIILNRDMTNLVVNEACKVMSGTLNDPYTATTIEFRRGTDTSDDVQIDHVVALSDAWQKGAQQLSAERKVAFANDPLNLLAVDGATNQQKSDGDAATWLPPNKPFRCQYVARQIAVKYTYGLWVTQSEKTAMHAVLTTCVGQPVPNIGSAEPIAI